jgi:hypothetical protein
MSVKSNSAVGLCFLLFTIAGSARATTMYDLSGTLNDNGPTISVVGTFDYNSSNNAVTNWDLVITGPVAAFFCGGLVPCYTFAPGTGASASFTPDLFTFTGPDGTGTTATLSLVPGIASSPLPDGTYSLNGSSFLLTNASGTIGVADFISGTLSAETSSTTPEPGTFPLLIVGGALLSIAMTRRRHSGRMRSRLGRADR